MALIARRLLVLLALAAAGALVWVLAARLATAKMGIVEITSEPGDAKVFVNGQRKGDTPTEPGKGLVLKLPEGQYRLEGLIDAPRLRWERRDLYVAAEAIQPVKLVLAAVEPEMVSIPDGTFLMGSDLVESLGYVAQEKWEKPLHSVDVPGFAIGKYEVTFAEWDACVADDGCMHTPGDEGWGRASHPVMNVTWDDAQQYVVWLSRKTGKPYRLPSEAEWNTPRVQVPQRILARERGSVATKPISAGPTIAKPIPRCSSGGPSRWVATLLTRGVFTICMAMSMNGLRTVGI